jgi:SAM-dependent methyltransferase
MDAPADEDPAALLSADEHARRAASFGAVALAYARHRPDYPAAAIRWALAPAEGLARHRVRILDLGAGTGKLTAQLARLTVGSGRPHVIAVEPDPHMLAELRRGWPRTGLPEVTTAAGRAEAIPLPDGSVDAVLAGQAAHWFDLDLAMPEIARVLAPSGVFAGLWNTDDDRVGWVAGLHRVTGRGNVAALSSLAGDDHDPIAAWLGGSGRGLFWPPEQSGFGHSMARTADSLIATMRTHSMFLIMKSSEREAVVARVREYLAATPQTAAGEFALPIWTIVQRTVRRPAPA